MTSHKEQAKKRWTDAFDNIYDKHPSLFEESTTLIIADTETMRCIGEDGREYELKPCEEEQ